MKALKWKDKHKASHSTGQPNRQTQQAEAEQCVRLKYSDLQLSMGQIDVICMQGLYWGLSTPDLLITTILLHCLDVLPTSMSVYHLYLVQMKVRRRHWPLEQNLQMLWATYGWWESNLGPKQEQVFSTTETSIQATSHLFNIDGYPLTFLI